MIDPTGTKTDTTFDDVGRQIQVVQDVDGLALTTSTTYHASGQIKTMTAQNADTTAQTTTYTYGSTLANSEIASNDLRVGMEYPEGGTESYAYNRQLQRTKVTDSGGTSHEYDYDALGRKMADKITAFGSGVDSSVSQIGWTYNARSLIEYVTSYNGATVVNQIKKEYNAFGQLMTEYQEHNGTVSTSTAPISPYVAYAYADGSANTIRPTQVTYPDGTVLTYDDGASGETNDRLSRVGNITWG